jgi:hypothetical protein
LVCVKRVRFRAALDEGWKRRVPKSLRNYKLLAEDIMLLAVPLDILLRLKTRESHGTTPLSWDIKARG